MQTGLIKLQLEPNLYINFITIGIKMRKVQWCFSTCKIFLRKYNKGCSKHESNQYLFNLQYLRKKSSKAIFLNSLKTVKCECESICLYCTNKKTVHPQQGTNITRYFPKWIMTIPRLKKTAIATLIEQCINQDYA